MNVGIIIPYFRCVWISPAWFTATHLSHEIPMDVITKQKTIIRKCNYYPWTAYSRQEVGKSSLSPQKPLASHNSSSRWKRNDAQLDLGMVLHFTATWQISLASVKTQLGPNTLRGDQTPLLTLTLQADRTRGDSRYLSQEKKEGGLLHLCSSIVGMLLIKISWHPL